MNQFMWMGSNSAYWLVIPYLLIQYLCETFLLFCSALFVLLYSYIGCHIWMHIVLLTLYINCVSMVRWYWNSHIILFTIIIIVVVVVVAVISFIFLEIKCQLKLQMFVGVFCSLTTLGHISAVIYGCISCYLLSTLIVFLWWGDIEIPTSFCLQL